MSLKSEMARLIDGARRRGWNVDRTRNSHYRLRLPGSALLHLPSTPSDPRSIRNADAMIRHAENRAVSETAPSRSRFGGDKLTVSTD